MNTTYVRRLAVVCQQLTARAQAAVDERNRERGASILEWVVISAVVLGIAIGVGAILKNALTSGATSVANNVTSNTQ